MYVENRLGSSHNSVLADERVASGHAVLTALVHQ
jgi:hypothetical protein